MLPLSPDELVRFELFCDLEEVPHDERAAIIGEVFGEQAAAMYSEQRCKVLAFTKENDIAGAGESQP